VTDDLGTVPRLGLRANLAQFALLVVVNALVGGMLGQERTVLPLLAEDVFGLASYTAALTYILAFGLAKAATNYLAGIWSERHGRKPVLVAGWLVALPVPLMLIWAPSWWVVVVANVLLGVSQGLTWSTTVIMKIDLVGPRQRGLALGINESAGYLAVGYAFGPILLSFFVAVYTAARHRPFRRAVPWALVALVFLSVHAFTNSASLPGLSGAMLASGWVVVPFAIGATRRVTREAVERERAEMIRQRVDLERLRVAHEVHDIVGHGLAAMKMQAEVALHVLPKRPEQAREALEAISRTSGEALDELRTTLGSVRDPTAELERSEPRLERLGDLQQRMTDAGVRVQVEVAGDPRPLPPAVDLSGLARRRLTDLRPPRAMSRMNRNRDP
jgi:signal transduction histidine kinase